MSVFQDSVYRVVREVPRGTIVSYGGVAAILGKPRAARGVGRALCCLPDDSDVPWWRVVNRNGEISIKCATHGAAVQRAMLEREGVHFDDAGRIDWRRFGWKGPDGAREDDSPGPPAVKRSVALAIIDPRSAAGRGSGSARRGGRRQRGERAVLLVQRPPDDEDLPDVWGLPAASLRPGEDWRDAAHRAAAEKLGVTVDVLGELARGSQHRGGHTLDMRLFAARLADGEPSVPQSAHGVTQYVAFRWGGAADLEPGAARGSLCCRLYSECAGAGSRAGRADRSRAG